MLTLHIPSVELFDEKKQEFIYTKGCDLRLEHSLVSLSKWEAKWNKPFLTKTNKTTEETLDYIRCMTITQNVDPDVYNNIPNREMEKIAEYIDSPMTATTFSIPKETKTNKEIVTSEIIYYWLVAFNIPFECQTWHLNRLLTLINVCSIKNQPAKKTKLKDRLAQQKALNDARRAKFNTKG